jgi:hypothetical protein
MSRGSTSAAGIGQWIGEAIGEGIALGAQHAFEQLGQDIAPIVAAMVDSLRQEMIDAAARAAPAVEAIVLERTRHCEEAGCPEPALARNLCRKHYARKLYQERKQRQDVGGALPRRRARREFEGESVVEKKMAAVAPIIRRKRAEPVPAVAEVIQPLAAAANGSMPMSIQMPVATALTPAPLPPPPGAGPSVTPESVARFFGLLKT